MMHRSTTPARALLAAAILLGLAAGPARAQAPESAARPAAEAKLFAPGAISTGDYELNAAFSPDGGTLYFTKASPDPRFTSLTIVSARMDRGKWTTPEVVSFSGRYPDVDPALSPDGSKLFFVSKRPVEGTAPKEDFDIWVADRTGKDKWGEPRRLDAPINTGSEEFYPAVAASGNLYFASARGESLDLYRARFVDGKYAEPENLGPAVNSEHAEVDVYVAPDESFIVFVSYRPGQGNGDLYISYNRGGAWSPAQNLGDQVNTPAREYTPAMTPNGKYLFWTSDRSLMAEPGAAPMTYEELSEKLHNPGNGLGDLYMIDLAGVQPMAPAGADGGAATSALSPR